MAYTPLKFTGNGSTTDYQVSWPKLRDTHVKVTVNGANRAFTWQNTSTVRISPAPANASAIVIYRETPSTLLHTLQDNRPTPAFKYNENNLQAIYVAEEVAAPPTGEAGADHGTLSGLGDDDHTIYVKADGTRKFTGKSGYTTHPTFSADTDIVDKKYVDDALTTVTGDHGELAGLGDDDHTQYARTDGQRDLTGVQAYASHPVFDDPLQLVDKQYVDELTGDMTGLHSELAGLLDDDHPQYLREDGSRDLSAVQKYAAHPTFANPTELVDKKYVDDAIAATGAATDHGTLSGLGDDDHPQYLKTDGTRDLTGIQAYGSHPTFTSDNQLVDKKYVDDKVIIGGGYTDEQAQDAVGAALTADLAYNDGTNSIGLSTANITKLGLAATALQPGSADLTKTALSGAPAKTTPVDADSVAIVDSADLDNTKRVTWANVKATLKAYFDPLYAAASTLLTAIAGLSSNGMVVRTGASTAVIRSIDGGTGITVTNGDGVSGNPTVALSSGSQTSLAKADSALQSSDIGTTVQAHDADTLKADTDDVLGAGYTTTAINDGIFAAATYTPTPLGRNWRRIVRNGAVQIAAPSFADDYQLLILIENGASAGAITYSGFTKNPTGDAFTSTNGHKFLLSITKHTGVIVGEVKACQ